MSKAILLETSLGLPAICQCCKISMMQNGNDAKWQWSKMTMIQVILFEFDCSIFTQIYIKLFCKFISWTNWVKSGKFMKNCSISCQVMTDMKKVYDNLIIINLYNYVNVPKCQWQLNANNTKGMTMIIIVDHKYLFTARDINYKCLWLVPLPVHTVGNSVWFISSKVNYSVVCIF